MAATTSTSSSYRRVARLLAETPLIDGHNDLPWAMRVRAGYDFAIIDPTGPAPELHTDIPRLRRGLVGGQFWSVYVPSTLAGPEAVAATLEQIDFVHRFVATAPGDLQLVTTATGVRAAFAEGRVASLVGAEGGHSIAESLGVLRALFALGVRYLTLTHNHNTPWADAATDEPACGGLTDFGREVVAEMNRLGMIVDLSHTAPQTMAAALDTTSAPVVFTHSSCRALVDHVRNVPDDVLARLTVNGGVCMVAFVPDFVNEESRAWRAAGSEGEAPRASIADVADHVEHVREVAGVDHVGIGADYDGCDRLPDGLEDVSTYPRLFEELCGRGWSDAELAKLAGGNVLRALADVEASGADVIPADAQLAAAAES